VNLRETLTGAVVMAPMTKGSNLPYRRLCVELGARVTISEMTVARRLKQRRKGEFALIRKFDGEPFFGVQLAGTNPEEIAGRRRSSNPAAPIWSISTAAARSITSRTKASARRWGASRSASGASPRQ